MSEMKKCLAMLPEPGTPAAFGSWASQREGARSMCKDCPLLRSGFRAVGVVIVYQSEIVYPKPEENKTKSWGSFAVCRHPETRASIDPILAPDAALRLLEPTFEEGLTLAKPDEQE